jgi:hypothetical protein
MPPIIVLALGVLAASALVHGVAREVRRLNVRVKKRRAIEPVSREVLRRDLRSAYPTMAASANTELGANATPRRR